MSDLIENNKSPCFVNVVTFAVWWNLKVYHRIPCIGTHIDNETFSATAAIVILLYYLLTYLCYRKYLNKKTSTSRAQIQKVNIIFTFSVIHFLYVTLFIIFLNVTLIFLLNLKKY